ncbi:hypothetical protein [Halopseudomonas bauzanensis]|uniref:hypothetical protein n=1 Tax=Halopseudomonas bauzanensis TaxID=653930 RepID=UPI0025550DBE|nr:hypothetical protein [Halopseudomonas bauzanensis]
MRSDAEKAAEQYRIAAGYQGVADQDARRQDRDGVVVTPVEIVDFQIRSVLDSVQQMGREPDEGIEWLDPFGGSGIYTARLLQLVDLPPHRKQTLAENCVVIELDPTAAQIAANNLAAVYHEEIGAPGCVRVICADTFTLPARADLWDDALPAVQPQPVSAKHPSQEPI